MRLKGISVLVTGATGFIGSHLTRQLVKEGAEVSIFIRPTSSLNKIKDSKGKINIYKVDITDLSLLRKLVKKVKPQKVFHLAAYTDAGRSFNNIVSAIRVNVQGTMNLLSALEEVDYSCFVNTGSSEEYGCNNVPFTEEQKVDPLSPYAASKSANWLFCNMCYQTFSCPIVTLRPFLVYGPYQESNRFIPQFIISALRKKDFKMTAGEQTREFTYVTDIVEGYIRASMEEKAIGETINLCTGREYVLREVVNKIDQLMGEPIKILVGALPYRTKELWRLYGDGSKANQLLGWEPKVGLETGLQMTIKWYRKNIWFIKGGNYD